MKESISKVKAAIAPKDIASHLSHYLVKDGFIHASDNRLVAAAPFPLAGTFLVPGGDFEAVAERFGENTKLTVSENSVVFTDGKMKATLKTLPVETVQYDKPQGKRRKLPADFLKALTRIRPFISDNAVHFWALSVCLEKDLIFATNNIVVAASECKGLNGEGRLLPAWAIDYLLTRSEDLESFISDPNAMTFFWSDGSWMKAQLVDSKFPAAAEKLLEELPKPSFKLSNEWKAAYNTVAEMSENVLEIYADRVVGLTANGQMEINLETPVPEGGVSKWNSKFLNPVVAIAEYWSPELWPKPSPFSGPGIKGLIVGRN